jgi:hypothetical protein
MRIRAGILVVGLILWPCVGEAQLRVRDLVVTGGVAAEGYSGNLAAVTIAVVDSTDSAAAAVGEFSSRLDLEHISADARSRLRMAFDLGLRQFAATGFKVRDYAPREWVGSGEAVFSRAMSSWGSITGVVSFKGRWVEDRPPMPLFLQPGYSQIRAGAQVNLVRSAQFDLDFGFHGRREDYRATDPVKQLDLLGRNALSLEGGVSWRGGARGELRFFTTFERSEYPQQGSFEPDDPLRLDHTFRTGLTWTRFADEIDVILGLEGTLNRSNSRRPEYDAVALRGEVSIPLWWDLGMDVYTVITGKSYLFETDFARLVPGEEADNASVAYVTFTRPLAPNLDAALRVGWTRAETDIGDQYYERYGLTLLFNYRPTIR